MQTAQAAEEAAAEARWRSGEQAGELEAAAAREREARLCAEAEAHAMQQERDAAHRAMHDLRLQLRGCADALKQQQRAAALGRMAAEAAGRERDAAVAAAKEAEDAAAARVTRAKADCTRRLEDGLAACAAHRRAVEAAADRRADRAQREAAARVAAAKEAARRLVVAVKRSADEELQRAGRHFKEAEAEKRRDLEAALRKDFEARLDAQRQQLEQQRQHDAAAAGEQSHEKAERAAEDKAIRERVWQRRMDALQQDSDARVEQATSEAAAARASAVAARQEAAKLRQERLDQDSAWAERLETARTTWQQERADSERSWQASLREAQDAAASEQQAAAKEAAAKLAAERERMKKDAQKRARSEALQELSSELDDRSTEITVLRSQIKHLQRRTCRCLANCRGGPDCPCDRAFTICITSPQRKATLRVANERIHMRGPGDLCSKGRSAGCTQLAANKGVLVEI